MKQKGSNNFGIPDSLVPARLYEDKRQRVPGFVFWRARKLLALSALVLLVVCLSLYAPRLKHFWQKSGQEASVEKKVLAATELPAGLPSDLPFLSDELVMQNFTASTADGAVQASRRWRVDRGVPDLLAAYDAYFAHFKWDITTRVSEQSFMLIGASKDSLYLSVSAKKAEPENVSIMEVSLRRATQPAGK